MSWRPGEVWLDTDGAWLRPGDVVAAAAVLEPLPLPSFERANGLSASRERRAAWQRRRHTRRARATALAISPAVVFALAGLRSDRQAAAAPVLAEDPPSQTLRLPTPRAVPPRGAERAVGETGAAARPASTAATPEIQWHRARSVGVPHGGRLEDGTQLPVRGPDWATWNPVTDSAPNAPTRLYGHERVIRAVLSVSSAYRAANPGAPRVLIGDISRKGGGPMHDEHVSHQNGLDVDVYLPRLDRTLQAPRTFDQIDRRLAQDLVERFVAAGARIVFVGYGSGLHGPAGVVVPYSGHDFHMHVRFATPGA